MIKRFFSLLTLAIFAIAFTSFADSNLPSAGAIKWYYDLDEALKVAKAENKILMVDVYTDWCSWCHELDRVTYSDKLVQALATNLISVKINPEKDKRAQKFSEEKEVTGYPAIIFIDANEKVLFYQSGFAEAKPFANIMEMVLSFDKKEEYQKEFENGKYINSLKLINIYLAQDSTKNATKVFDVISVSKLYDDEIIAEKAIEIGMRFGEQGNYEDAIKYLDVVTTKFKHTSMYYQARYFEIYAHILSDKFEESEQMLEEILKDKKLNSDERAAFEGLTVTLENIKAAGN